MSLRSNISMADGVLWKSMARYHPSPEPAIAVCAWLFLDSLCSFIWAIWELNIISLVRTSAEGVWLCCFLPKFLPRSFMAKFGDSLLLRGCPGSAILPCVCGLWLLCICWTFDSLSLGCSWIFSSESWVSLRIYSYLLDVSSWSRNALMPALEVLTLSLLLLSILWPLVLLFLWLACSWNVS